MNGFKYTELKRNSAAGLYPTARFGINNAERVNAFHRSFPEYAETPLVRLEDLSSSLGLGSLYVKDESFRFGLNAFKVLGGSYAIGRYIAERLGINVRELTYETLVSPETRKKLGDITFVTATDGNHGRGVAWTASRIGQRSVVYMPHGTAYERLANIRALGSDAYITEMNYDDCVRLARLNAAKFGWITVQDTSGDEADKIPAWIMEGYTTMAHEAARQLGGIKPTHIFLQAGVGSMAAAAAAYFSELYGKDRPIIAIAEPNAADCIYRTAEADDGKLRFVTGDMDTIMAGLACGEPCRLAWNILHDYADFFISMPDSAAVTGMRALGRPTGSDSRIISGESGASTVGLVCEIMRNGELSEIRSALGLNETSMVLCFSTEGDTDKENYKKIMA